ncbi:MAG TPA: DapH/DapD/GlmU-related protein [Solirubrobacterales bacterium]|nr:DapH/DapD/GlmU-related protein [Solirubrobacterales bacterium]
MAALRPSNLAPNLLVGERLRIDDEVEIGPNVVLYDDITLEKGVQLDVGAVVGRPARRNRRSRTAAAVAGPTVLEEGAIVSPYGLVSSNVRMGAHSFLGDYAHLREGVRLGLDVTVGANAGIGRNVEIGDGTRMQNGCLIGPNTIVEEGCFLGPTVQVLTGRPMRGPRTDRPSALRRGCQIGAGATILPGLEIGEEAVVGAGAVVVADVPAGALVRGVPARLAARDAGPVAPRS